MSPLTEFNDGGVVKLAAGEHPYSQEDVGRLRELCDRLPRKEGIGDENRVAVGRIVVDPVDVIRAELGYEPARVEDPMLADEILAVAASETALAYWSEALGIADPRVRRAQTNFLYEGGEVAMHTDHESNPDYQASVVMGLRSDYSGGDFLAIADDGREHCFRLEPGDVLVAKPDIPHAVTEVRAGTRMSLVMFLE
jgi:hypothetical protein